MPKRNPPNQKSSSELSEEAKKAAKDDDSTDKLRQRTVRAAIDMEKKDDSQNAMHAVKVGGNSMEPYFPDGSIAFCTKAPIENRDIGVFSIDGSSGSRCQK